MAGGLPGGWAEDGVVILPGWVDAPTVARLRAICDAALATWRGQIGEDSTNMAFLTDPRWYGGDATAAHPLVEWVASAAVSDLLAMVVGPEFVLHNLQYFPEPRQRTWMGRWHRDCQYLARTGDEERDIRAELQAWHLRIAFTADDHLEYVPGSHRREDAPAEAAARTHDGDHTLPGACRVPLQAGDGALFHAWGLHRGRYHAGRPRRTFDVILGSQRCARCPPDAFPPPIAGSGLSERARALLSRSALLAPA